MAVGYLGRQVAAGGGGGQGREPQARLVGAEGGWRLDERRRVAEGAEASLLREQLLVGHRVGEGEGGAAGQTLGSQARLRLGQHVYDGESHLSPPTDRCP